MIELAKSQFAIQKPLEELETLKKSLMQEYLDKLWEEIAVLHYHCNYGNYLL